MQHDSFRGWGLNPVELTDSPVLQRYLHSLRTPLSDYTFSQIFTWRNSLRLLWRLIDNHLCVFANGTGDLTLLLPPIADVSGQPVNAAALRQAFELMDDYNGRHGVADHSRVEYVSEELLGGMASEAAFDVRPMGHDYIYDTARMIDLAGGDLKSKRQERGRFMRDRQYEATPYQMIDHLEPCLRLLEDWKSRQDASHGNESSTNAMKRQKESLATGLTLQHATELGLNGLVVHVDGKLAGFTFGERLGTDQASIVVEKTDLSIKGLPQFIFSEFCRLCWADRPRINAGDDWGLENLAWTKASYRPVELMPKFVVTRKAVARSASGFAAKPAIIFRRALRSDVPAVEVLERTSFDTYRLTRRQLDKFQNSSRAIFCVATVNDSVIGAVIALLRRTPTGTRARLYSLAVNADHRGQGVGRRLLENVIHELVERGVKRVTLQVESSNRAAIALYEQLDFRSVRILAAYYGPNRDGTQMVCDVSLPSEQVSAPSLKPAA